MVPQTNPYPRRIWKVSKKAHSTILILDVGFPRRQKALPEKGLSELYAITCHSQPRFYVTDEICNQKDSLNSSHMLLSSLKCNYVLRRNPSFLCFLYHPTGGFEKLINIVLLLIDVPEHQPFIRTLVDGKFKITPADALRHVIHHVFQKSGILDRGSHLQSND